MAFPPDLQRALKRLLRWARSASPRHSGRGWAGGRSGRWAGERPRDRGSALVPALMAGLVALIGALLLTSRLFSSRFNSFSRSDSLAAREAAEFGLNELQSRLNTDQRAYLWVTKRANWSSVTRNDLTSCQVSSLDASGNEATTLPGPPDGVSSPRTIQTGADTTISYQLTGFEPPALPDNEATTRNQADFCSQSNTAAAANFGNLNGGSALITVTGTITRGSGMNAKTSNFQLRRTIHVAAPGSRLAYSFMILGNAYEDKDKVDPVSPASFRNKSEDIALLNRLDGNICYPTSQEIALGQVPTSCFNPERPKTIIGCQDLAACLINNVENLSTKKQLENCGVKVGKKKPKSFTCNSFQQAAPPPPIPTPTSELTAVSEAQWPAFAYKLTCSLKRDKNNLYNNCTSIRDANKDLKTTKDETKDQYVAFPYKVTDSKSNKLTLTRSELNDKTNGDLVRGCYFSNTSPSDLTAKFSNQTHSINCLVEDLTIQDTNDSNPNLTIHTIGTDGSTLPVVNLFLWGTSEIKLDGGGIQSNDSSRLGWSRTRLLGKSVITPAGQPISCTASSRIKSYKKNDLNNLFIWLPNSNLRFEKPSVEDNAYLVAWVCSVSGFKGSSGSKFSVVTPLPEDVVRSGLTRTLGPSFVQSAGFTYRGFGSMDSLVN